MRIPKRLAENSQLGFESDQSRGEQAHRRERSGMETAVSEYVSLGFAITGYKFVFETQVAHQLPHGRRKSRALRPGPEEKAVSPDVSNQAARACRGLLSTIRRDGFLFETRAQCPRFPPSVWQLVRD